MELQRKYEQRKIKTDESFDEMKLHKSEASYHLALTDNNLLYASNSSVSTVDYSSSDACSPKLFLASLFYALIFFLF